MRRETVWFSSLGIGAATAFVLDPISGKRRRHHLADAAVHFGHVARRWASATACDLRNRTKGLMASLSSTFNDELADDAVLEERVRAALGRVVSHPHAIKVTARNGRVVLDG